MTARKEAPRTRDRLLAALKDDDFTIRDLERVLNRGNDTVLRHIEAEHSSGNIHVCDWRESGFGPSAAVYRFGPGKDVRKPRAKPGSVRSARYREKNAGLLRAKRLAVKMPVNPFSALYLG